MLLSTDNLTAVLYKAKDIRLEQRPIPEPKDNEVLIQMVCVGICGSDVHYWQHGQIGKYVVEKPMILGHEPSGTVIKTGKSVTNLIVGDRVAIEPGTTCRVCTYCKSGRYHLCPDVKYLATPPDDGCITRYYAHAADLCYKLPQNVSFEEGALVQPLAIGIHTAERADIRLGSTVLITGSGPIGQVTLLAARSMGASKIICTDLLEHRLEVAKQCGADYTLLVKPDDNEDDVVQKIVDFLGDLPTNSIDCIGVQATIRLCMKATRHGGVMAVVGMGSQEVMVPMCRTAAKEIDIRGVFRFVNNYPTALAMIESGKIDVKQLITHRFTLEETLKAYETAKTGEGNPVKILIYCNKMYSDDTADKKGVFS